MNVKVTTLGSL